MWESYTQRNGVWDVIRYYCTGHVLYERMMLHSCGAAVDIGHFYQWCHSQDARASQQVDGKNKLRAPQYQYSTNWQSTLDSVTHPAPDFPPRQWLGRWIQARITYDNVVSTVMDWIRSKFASYIPLPYFHQSISIHVFKWRLLALQLRQLATLGSRKSKT